MLSARNSFMKVAPYIIKIKRDEMGVM